MSIIDFEIDEIRKLCENVVPNSKIIALTSAPAPLVRVDIRENQVHRQITACLRFPAATAVANNNSNTNDDEDLLHYPRIPLLIELKSRTLSQRFLDALTTLCDAQARQQLGKPQCLHVLRFIQQYLRENPLCVCFDEIQALRRDLDGGGGASGIASELKLKQRTALVQLIARGGTYYFHVRATIPDEYPRQCAELLQPPDGTNLPPNLRIYLMGQSREIARQCCEAPLRLARDPVALAAFEATPSLYRALRFCLEATRDFPAELCPVCDVAVLPAEAKCVELDDTKDAFVERVYCGHLFHQGCLKRYLQEPPFPKGGKLCPAKRRHLRSDCSYGAGTRWVGGGGGGKKPPTVGADTGGICGIRLAHDRWVVSVKVAETRWAQKQARERELQEVMDFLK